MFCNTCLEAYHSSDSFKNHLDSSITVTDHEMFNENKEALKKILM